MKCCEVVLKLEELSPPMYAEKWDNVGLLIGRKEKNIKSIYLALDATDEVVEDAADKGVDLLITHHPLLFSPMKRICSDDFIGRRAIKLISNDISYYAMHTNFDVMGMADAAADEIGLRNRQVLSITYEDEIAKEGFGRVGQLNRIMSLRECAEYIKQKFHIPSVRVFGDLDATLEKAAISPGSGKSMIDAALKSGAEVLITGDIGHHEGIDAVAQGLMIIDAGHFGIEQIFVSYMKEYIEREIPGLQVFTEIPKSPFVVL